MTLGSGLLLGLAPPPIKPIAPPPDPNAGQLAGLQDAPSATTEPGPTSRTGLGSPARAWQWIIVHQSNHATGSLAEIDREYRDKGFRDGCIYHLVVNTDGSIEESGLWARQDLAPAKLEDGGSAAIHIVAVGNFDTREASKNQLIALNERIARLARKFGIASQNIILRPLVNPPGRKFPQQYPL